MHLPMRLSSKKQGIEIVEEGFLDSGAGGKFIDQNYAKMKGFEQEPFLEPIPVYNVDGTPNKRGTIRHYVDLTVNIHGRARKERLLVTGLGKHKIILGFPWLKEANPIIDWRKGTLDWRRTKSDEDVEDETPVIAQASTTQEQIEIREPNKEDDNPWGHSDETREKADEETKQFAHRAKLVDEWNAWRK
jgi:hypothetical protein